MKIFRKRVIFPVILLVLIAGAVWYVYHVKNSNKPVVAPGSSYVPKTSAAVSAKDVKMENFAFTPSDIKIKAGTTVTWTNQDFVGYTVTEDDDQAGPASTVIKQNQTYTFKFTKPGLYHYHNSLDPQMSGTVTVE